MNVCDKKVSAQGCPWTSTTKIYPLKAVHEHLQQEITRSRLSMNIYNKKLPRSRLFMNIYNKKLPAQGCSWTSTTRNYPAQGCPWTSTTRNYSLKAVPVISTGVAQPRRGEISP